MEILRKYLPYLEAFAVYGSLVFLLYKKFIPVQFSLILLLPLGTLFSLFYAVTGLFISLGGLGAVLAAFFLFFDFHLRDFLEIEGPLPLILANIGNYLLAGFWARRCLSEKRGLVELTQMLKTRLGFAVAHLASIERAYQEIFHKTYSMIGEPRFFYHELRAIIRKAKDIRDLWGEVFLRLERDFGVEGGAIYRRTSEGYQEVARFGVCSLPQRFSRSELPDWLYLAEREEELVVPHNVEKAGVMAVLPFLPYVLVIQRARYTLLVETVLMDLERILFCVKLFIEKYFEMERLRPLSIHPRLVVYREDVSLKLLRERIKIFQKFNFPFVLAKLTFPNRDELLRAVEIIREHIRETDELFQIRNHLIILYFMAKDFDIIRERIKRQIGLELKKIDEISKIWI